MRCGAGEAKGYQDAAAAQNQSSAAVQNTQTQPISGVPITITNFGGALFSNGQYGVTISATANCTGCTDWVQTITRLGAGDVFGREFVDKGNTSADSVAHYSENKNPVYGGSNHFSDTPTAPNGGSFKAVMWVGSADLKNKTFTPHAAFAYGFSVSKGGKLSVMNPRAATNAERAHSLATMRADTSGSRGWTIN